MNGVIQSPDRPRFGEIWMCNLCQDSGSVQRGSRPVFIVSNNLNNVHSPVLNVIPLTSRLDKKPFPMHVFLCDPSLYGLRRPSTMLVEQITTVQASTCTFKIGCVSDQETLAAIYGAIKVQFPVVGMFSSGSAA